jgi:alpha-L-fucosidase
MAALLCAYTIGHAAPSTPPQKLDRAEATPQATDDRLAWFTDARFGMFIHWAPVSLTGHEIGWSRGVVTPREEYDNLYLRFDPVGFDADAIAQLAVDAGMKYVVFTTKHHDGFCMWDAAETDFDIMATPFARDVVAELAEACRSRGLHFGLYYSVLDWYHPHYYPQNPQFGGAGEALPDGVEPDLDVYVDYMKAQLAELITRFEPDLIWFDGAWESGTWTDERGEDLVAFVRELDPDILINNRAMRGDHATDLDSGDYLTPEQKLGTFNRATPWETCMTIGTQWAWKPNDTVKSLASCLRSLVFCAAGDGNLLLNVGPTDLGVVDPEQAERLREMGAWLDDYGHTVYGTRGGPWRPGEWGGSTCRGNKVYLHVFHWPLGRLVLPAYGQRITDARLLTGDAEVQWSQDASGRLSVGLPAEARDPINTVIELTVDGAVDRLAEPGGPVHLFESDERFGAVVSRHATFTTSSAAHWDNPDHHTYLLNGAEDAPEFAFHTLEEEHPWVTIDLGGVYEVTGLLIENRPLYEAKSAGLGVSISVDGQGWDTVWQADDTPRRWTVPITRAQAGIQVPGQPARYVRLRIERGDPTYFHLRSVEVWGNPTE